MRRESCDKRTSLNLDELSLLNCKELVMLNLDGVDWMRLHMIALVTRDCFAKSLLKFDNRLLLLKKLVRLNLGGLRSILRH